MAIHGGAGLIRKHALPDEAVRREVLAAALDAGVQHLARGGDALEACLRAVEVMEDAPEFNAGRGGVLADDGTVQMDASVMHGADRSAGGVAAIRGIRHPVRLADAVRTATPHVLLAGVEAEAFAAAQGMERQPLDWFVTEARRAHLARAVAAGRLALDHDLDDDTNAPLGTVGAVARDAAGHVAAATSTGGLANKMAGRVGDSPIVGAGTFACDTTCAVSATGTGEAILRAVSASRIASWMELRGLSLEEAAHKVVHEELPRWGGTGGVIAVDASGRIAMPFCSAGMYRASRDTEGKEQLAIW